MKIIVTTSDKYLHIVPIFAHLFNKYWGADVELVGYKEPDNLPSNFTFHSMGEQTDIKSFTRDLREYFKQQDQFFIWMMEDTFIKEPVDIDMINTVLTTLLFDDTGRINLSHEVLKQDSLFYTNRFANGWRMLSVYENTHNARYRLSTQPSIWNRDFVLEYMQEDLSPWEFECQPYHKNDKWKVLGLSKEDSPIKHNEGVRKSDLSKYDLNGIEKEVEHLL